MKNYLKDSNSKVFIKNNKIHRLKSPAVEYKNGDKWYYINNICYMIFNKNSNILYIYSVILKLFSKYEKYIKQNIKKLIQEYNPKIELHFSFEKRKINELPNWLKDLIIL